MQWQSASGPASEICSIPVRLDKTILIAGVARYVQCQPGSSDLGRYPFDVSSSTNAPQQPSDFARAVGHYCQFLSCWTIAV